MNRVIILLSLSLLVTLSSQNAQANNVEDSFIVLNASRGCSFTRGEGTIRLPLKEGSVLVAGDHVAVPGGSRLQIVLDDTFQSLLEIEGPGTFTLLAIHPTQINLPNGKIVGIMHKYTRRGSVEIYTPNTLSTVEGSDFEVVATAGDTKYVVHRGSIKVKGRLFNSRASLFPYMTIPSGHFVDVDNPRYAPAIKRNMNYAQSIRLNRAKKSVIRALQNFGTRSQRMDWMNMHKKYELQQITAQVDAVVPAAPAKSSNYSINDLAGKYVYY